MDQKTVKVRRPPKEAKYTPHSVGVGCAAELRDLVGTEFTGQFSLEVSIKDGGIATVDYQPVPTKKQLRRALVKNKNV